MEAPADPKAAYETARKELIAALQKKRAVDKSLVRTPAPCLLISFSSDYVHLFLVSLALNI